MPVINRFADFQNDLVAFRHDLHRHPELLYEVHRTAGKVAERLKRTHHDNVKATGDDWSTVQGTVFDVTDEEIARADAFEAQYNYKRIHVPLASGKEAWCYVHAD